MLVCPWLDADFYYLFVCFCCHSNALDKLGKFANCSGIEGGGGSKLERESLPAPCHEKWRQRPRVTHLMVWFCRKRDCASWSANLRAVTLDLALNLSACAGASQAIRRFLRLSDHDVTSLLARGASWDLNFAPRVKSSPRSAELSSRPSTTPSSIIQTPMRIILTVIMVSLVITLVMSM